MVTGEQLFQYVGIDMGWVLIITIVCNLVMLGLIIVLFVRNGQLKKKYDSFLSGEDGRSLETVITGRFKEMDEMKKDVSIVEEQLRKVDTAMWKTYKKMALVRYDAFQEIGGQLSFALALLTSNDDGFIINAVHSTREGCYIYAKEVVRGKCELELSEEEQKALDTAKKK